jgi:hypothetical protein
MSLTKQSSAYEVLKIRDFRHYVLGRTFITLGVNIVGTAVGWQIYEYTKDALSLGMIGLAVPHRDVDWGVYCRYF